MQKNAANESVPFAPLEQTKTSGGDIFLFFVVILIALWVQTVLRLWIAGDVLLRPTIENQFGALVHWRGLDQFTGWIILAILAAAEDTTQKDFIRFLLQIEFLVGVAALTFSLIWNDATGLPYFDLAVSVLISIAAVRISWRQMRELAAALTAVPHNDPPTTRGLNIEQLWRGITVQWIFLWIAADVALFFHFRKDGVDAQPKAREFLFVLPVVGVMTNMMMALGIKWWSALRAEFTPPRLRAWLISIAAVNAGAVAIALGFRFGLPFTIAGEILLLLGIALYLLGFPNNAWSSRMVANSNTQPVGGKLVPFAFILLFLGIAMMTTENFFPNDVPTLYAYAWHHLFTAAPILWLVGFGAMTAKRFAPPRILVGTNTAALAAIVLFLLGVFTLAATFLLGIHDRDTLRGLFVGATLEAAGLLLFSLLFLRIARGIK